MLQLLIKWLAFTRKFELVETKLASEFVVHCTGNAGEFGADPYCFHSHLLSLDHVGLHCKLPHFPSHAGILDFCFHSSVM